MNPDVPEPHIPAEPGTGETDAIPPSTASSHEVPSGSTAERPSDREIVASPFPSRRQVHQDSSRQRSIFPSAAGMDKAREMAAEILEDAPHPLTAAKAQVSSVPWWKWSAAAVLAIAAVVSVPLGGWETTLSAADTVQSAAMGEAKAVGPFSVTVGKAGWFKDIVGIGYADPKKNYLVMRVTITDFSAKGPLPAQIIGDVLNVYLEGQTPVSSADLVASGSLSDAVEDLFGVHQQNVGLSFSGAMRGTDENPGEAIQPGFDQDFFAMWVLPEGAEMTSHVTVRINTLKERRSTLDDTKVWADPKSLAYIDLPVAPVQEVQ